MAACKAVTTREPAGEHSPELELSPQAGPRAVGNDFSSGFPARDSWRKSAERKGLVTPQGSVGAPLRGLAPLAQQQRMVHLKTRWPMKYCRTDCLGLHLAEFPKGRALLHSPHMATAPWLSTRLSPTFTARLLGFLLSGLCVGMGSLCRAGQLTWGPVSSAAARKATFK